MAFFTEAELRIMWDRQNTINCIAAGTDWRIQNLPWSLPTIAELIEAADHIGWKWWKHQTPNIPQAKLELVDAFHFALSGAQAAAPVAEFSELWEAIEESVLADESILAPYATYSSIDVIREAISAAGNESGHMWLNALVLSAVAFMALDTDATYTEFFRMYVGKNCLNEFRQANGYKTNTYQKMWFGAEDNVTLASILDTLKDTPAEELESAVLAALTTEYAKVQEAAL